MRRTRPDVRFGSKPDIAARFGHVRYTLKSTIIIAALALAALTTATSAQQQRTFYDASGRSLGRSTTDSQGTVTNTDACGKVISREHTSGNTTTVYDAGGRNVGKVTTSPQR